MALPSEGWRSHAKRRGERIIPSCEREQWQQKLKCCSSLRDTYATNAIHKSIYPAAQSAGAGKPNSTHLH